MKAKYKRSIVKAMSDYLVDVTEHKTFPLVFSGYHLLDKSTMSAEGGAIGHPYARKHNRMLVRVFGQDLIKEALSKGISVVKIPDPILHLVASGKQAVVDETGDQTTAAYGKANRASKGKPYTGYVVFGKECSTDHPILGTSVERDLDRADSYVTKAEERARGYAVRGHLSQSVIEELNGKQKAVEDN